MAASVARNDPPGRTGDPPDVSVTFDGIDQLQEWFSGMGRAIRVTQLGKGRLRGSHDGWERADAYLFHRFYDRRIHFEGMSPPSRTTFVIPSQTSPQIRFNGGVLSQGKLGVVAPGADIDVTTFGEAAFIGLQVDAATVHHSQRTLFGDHVVGDTDSRIVSLTPGHFASLSQLLPSTYSKGPPRLEWSDGAGVGEDAVRILLEQLILATASNRAMDLNKRGGAPNRSAQRAKDLIESNLNRRISIEELCNETGASVRTLFHSFKQTYGISPLAYSKYRRLRQAHNRLATGQRREVTVTEAAATHGFWHFGRFASEYKAVFGESPSTTLSRQG